jgi:hypothetical protein
VAEKPRWKILVGKHKTIKLKLKEIYCDAVNWIHLIQYRNQWRGLVKAVEPTVSVKGQNS